MKKNGRLNIYLLAVVDNKNENMGKYEKNKEENHFFSNGLFLTIKFCRIFFLFFLKKKREKEIVSVFCFVFLTFTTHKYLVQLYM